MVKANFTKIYHLLLVLIARRILFSKYPPFAFPYPVFISSLPPRLTIIWC